MNKIQSPVIEQLLQDLRFSPRKQKIAQLENASKLFDIIQPETDYTYEFICFFITSYRPKENSVEKVKGDLLKEDLKHFISALSSSLSIKIEEIPQEVYSINQIAEQFQVSTRTIQRWQNRGLLAQKFIFDDGRKRIGFTKNTIEDFVSRHPELVKSAQQFTKLTDEQKKEIIEKARTLVEEFGGKRQKIVAQLAKDTSRSRDTIRRLLIEYENTPGSISLFSRPSGVLSTKDEKEIYKMYCMGMDNKEISQKYHRSKSSVYRIINKRRLRELKKQKIDYMHNEQFDQVDAEQEIFSIPLEKLSQISHNLHESKFNSQTLPKYLDDVKLIVPLTREKEAQLFKRYNFLKHCAKKIIDGFDLSQHISSQQITKAERYLDQAQEVRRILIVSNLRLVVSIANRHAGWGTQLADLISDGNFSLMRAVEKFDYSRGFRFSTYASWAISKDFARRIPAEAKRLDRPSSVEIEDVQSDMRRANMIGAAEIEQAHQSLESVIENNLTDREQYIINNHYGLIRTGIKKKYKSLKQIGDEIGLSKERVRQLELIALQKLRQSMSPEEFELLTK